MPAHPHFTLLKAARLIDAATEAVQEQAAILLEGDAIRQIGTAETVQAPEGAPVREFDYGDATILPGLVDSHVHLNGVGDGRAGDELATLPDEVLTVQGGGERAAAPVFGRNHAAGLRRETPHDVPAARGGRDGHRAPRRALCLRVGQSLSSADI